MAVLDDIRDGKGLKPITFDCFTCKNDNCIASSAKTATYQCPGYKRKGTNADRIRAMTDEELAEMMAHGDCGYCEIHDYCFSQKGVDCDEAWLNWLKQEVKE